MGLEFRFAIRKGDFSLKVDESLPASGINALFGPSGCGKTTLLRAIAGLDRHPGSRLVIDGETWQDEKVFVPTQRRALGYVFQEPRLFSHLTVQQNIEYGRKRVPPNQRRVSPDDAIELLQIGQLLQRRPDRLSGGEKQRVAICRALAASPRLLLMDEPLAALDNAHKQEILPYIESLTRLLDIPMLYVSHSTAEVARLANHLLLLKDGGIAAAGPVGELLTRLDLPLARVEDAEAIIEGVVREHDDDYQLSQVDFSGGRFTVARLPHDVGDQVRLRVLARDVSVTLQHQCDTSILNIFPAVVDEIRASGAAQMTVRLNVQNTPLLARVTRKSTEVLGLQPGRQVFVQVKSVALLP